VVTKGLSPTAWLHAETAQGSTLMSNLLSVP